MTISQIDTLNYRLNLRDDLDNTQRIEEYIKIFKISSENLYIKGQISALCKISDLYRLSGNYTNSLKYVNRAEKLLPKLNQEKEYFLVSICHLKSCNYFVLGLFEKGVNEIDTAILILEKMPESDNKNYLLGFIYYDLASGYNDYSKEKKAIDSCNTFLKKSSFYFSKISKKFPKYAFTSVFELKNLGYVKLNEKKYDSSIYYFEKAKESDFEYGHLKAEIAQNLGDLYYIKKNFT